MSRTSIGSFSLPGGSAVLADGRIVRGFHGGAASFDWACADVNDAGHDRRPDREQRSDGGEADPVQVVARPLARELAMVLVGGAVMGIEEVSPVEGHGSLLWAASLRQENPGRHTARRGGRTRGGSRRHDRETKASSAAKPCPSEHC
jgi:hypothetical protein